MTTPNTSSSRRHFLTKLSALTAAAIAGLPQRSLAAEATGRSLGLSVRDFGARGDGATLDTSALQKVIDACAQNGGGTIHFPAGRYLSGTLFLKSGVTLDFDSGATLLGSPKLENYPSTIPAIRSYTDTYTERSLIYAEQAEHIALRGRGIIDGQGAAFRGPYKVRPYLIRMIGCRDVLIRDVTLQDSPMWVQHYLACDGVSIDGITVVSKCNANNDGIDIDGCQRVRIANCDIQSGDDAIVLKSTLDRPCKHVAVTNCVLSSDCNAFKLGTESNGGFENILLSNCAMYNTRLAGIALEMVDGGILDRVNISNITMDNVRAPIFIRLGNRARPFKEGMARPSLGKLRNVSISDVQAVGADRTGCAIAGLPEHPIENLTLSNIRLGFAGGGKQEDARRQVPEKADAYPEYSMFGILPAYGFYCRHVQNLALQNVAVSSAQPDARPSLVCDDVADLRIFAWGASSSAADAPVLWFDNVRQGLVEGCRAPENTGAWLRVDGKNSSRIRLLANDLGGAAKSVEIGPDVPAEAVGEEVGGTKR